MLNVRIASKADIETLARAVAGALSTKEDPAWPSLSQEEANAFLLTAGKGAVICEDLPSGDIVGLALLQKRNRNEGVSPGEIFSELNQKLFPTDGNFLQTVMAWVAPDYRRMGIGNDLMHEVERSAKHLGTRVVYAQTAGKNRTGLLFLRQLKYREVRRGPINEVVTASFVKNLQP